MGWSSSSWGTTSASALVLAAGGGGGCRRCRAGDGAPDGRGLGAHDVWPGCVPGDAGERLLHDIGYVVREGTLPWREIEEIFVVLLVVAGLRTFEEHIFGRPGGLIRA